MKIYKSDLKARLIDHVSLRRYLIDFSLIEREPAGHRYKIAESKLAQLFEGSVQSVDPFAIIDEFRTQREVRRKEWTVK